MPLTLVLDLLLIIKIANIYLSKERSSCILCVLGLLIYEALSNILIAFKGLQVFQKLLVIHYSLIVLSYSLDCFQKSNSESLIGSSMGSLLRFRLLKFEAGILPSLRPES